MSRACARRAGAREWFGLALLALPTALLGLDMTVLYLVVPSLGADLQPTSTQTLWIMDVYGFLIAGFLLTMGTVGDRVGRRRLLMIGAGAFGLASIVAALAPTAPLLILARALLGVAGATLMPSTLALIRNMFADERQRALAIGVWATMFAVGMAAGPVVGGALLAHFYWGSVFLLAVPIAGVVVAAAPFLLPEYQAPTAGRFDLPSVGLSLAAILPIAYAVKHTAADGFDGHGLAALAIGVSGAAVFVRRQRALPAPLVDISLFAGRSYSAALGILLVGLVGVGGVFYLVTQYLQLVEGISATVAGLWMGLPALAMLAGAIGAPLAARSIRPGFIIAGTLAVSLLGYGLLTTVGAAQLGRVVTAFALVYLGLGVIAALGTDIVVGAAPPSKAGAAAAMSETVQELGLATGVALLGSLTTAVYRRSITVADEVAPDAAISVQDSLSRALTEAHRVPGETIEQARAAFVTGLNISAAVAALAIVAAIAASAILLRHIPPLGR